MGIENIFAFAVYAVDRVVAVAVGHCVIFGISVQIDACVRQSVAVFAEDAAGDGAFVIFGERDCHFFVFKFGKREVESLRFEAKQRHGHGIGSGLNLNHLDAPVLISCIYCLFLAKLNGSSGKRRGAVGDCGVEGCRVVFLNFKVGYVQGRVAGFPFGMYANVVGACLGDFR